MSDRIDVLSSDTIGLIAAGEVIENVAAAIKELIENALDADARQIEVVATEGGLGTLWVRDDGCGIIPENLNKLCVRFATSKLRSYSELAAGVSTFGFRGEALSAMSYSARTLAVTTRAAGSRCAYRCLYKNGQMVGAAVKCAGIRGTVVRVEGLMYAQATRRRAAFVNDQYTEALRIVSSYGIHVAARGVGLSCRKAGGAPDVSTNMCQSTLEAIKHCLGPKAAMNALLVSEREEWLTDDCIHPKRRKMHASVLGYCSSGHHLDPGASGLQLWVNDRLVQHSALQRRVDETLNALSRNSTQQWAYLSLTLEPSTVDVNIHPTKSRVTFLHEARVIDFVARAVAKAVRPAVASNGFFSQSLSLYAHNLGAFPKRITEIAALCANASFEVQISLSWKSCREKMISVHFSSPECVPYYLITKGRKKKARSTKLAVLSVLQDSIKERERIYLSSDVDTDKKNTARHHLIACLLSSGVCDPSTAIFNDVMDSNQWWLPRKETSGGCASVVQVTSHGASVTGNTAAKTKNEIERRCRRKGPRQALRNQVASKAIRSDHRDQSIEAFMSTEKVRFSDLIVKTDGPVGGKSQETDKHKNESFVVCGDCGGQVYSNQATLTRPGAFMMMFSSHSITGPSSPYKFECTCTLYPCLSRRSIMGVRVSRCQYTSLTGLISNLKTDIDVHLADEIRHAVYVGYVNEVWLLAQIGSRLIALDYRRFALDLFFQLALRRFGRTSAYSISFAPVDTTSVLRAVASSRQEAADATATLISKADLLNDYFNIRIDARTGCLFALPCLLPGYPPPSSSAIPTFLFDLATKIDWKHEESCLLGIAALIADMYAKSTFESKPRHEIARSSEYHRDVYAPALSDYPSASIPRSVFCSKSENVLRLILFPAIKACLAPQIQLRSCTCVDLSSISRFYSVFERS